ncbi:hypothetical protein BHU72_10115 [Desulfuribacillus stibiiarsenatis]|uniref:Putative regulatory protein FmdB zinc ribbon domain-containing protein n=1 Tax=Desulfuribacillus stibiiarsenatis TaxID=1390249 RepID=A0A1E5L9A3_9FIRM|nr:zinc ribbon domain-containing protein [Desulfuribacillus stibiiarsenatis]OEH86604.1 hypothetical protein BHU72_10115 [Desulfuribacillus stibiiarsenatis]
MPIFDLQCKDCKHEYQVRASYEERQNAKCPACGSEKKAPVFKANVKGPVSSSGIKDTGCSTCPGSSNFG